MPDFTISGKYQTPNAKLAEWLDAFRQWNAGGAQGQSPAVPSDAAWIDPSFTLRGTEPVPTSVQGFATPDPMGQANELEIQRLKVRALTGDQSAAQQLQALTR